MKKIATVILATVLLASSFTYGAYASSRNVKVNVDNKEISFTEASPYIDSNGRVLVPLRFVSESIGAQVEWDSVKKEAVIIKDGKEIKVGDEAVISSGRTMVPVRFVSEALGAKVAWDKVTYTVVITTDGSEPVVSVEPVKPQGDMTVVGIPVELYNQFRPELKRLHDGRVFAKDYYGNDYTLPESVLNPKGIMTERQTLLYMHDVERIDSEYYKGTVESAGYSVESVEQMIDESLRQYGRGTTFTETNIPDFFDRDKRFAEFHTSKNILTNSIISEIVGDELYAHGIEVKNGKYRNLMFTSIKKEHSGQESFGFLKDYVGGGYDVKIITSDTLKKSDILTDWAPIPTYWN